MKSEYLQRGCSWSHPPACGLPLPWVGARQSLPAAETRLAACSERKRREPPKLEQWALGTLLGNTRKAAGPAPPPQSPPPSAPRPSPGGDRAGSAGGPTGTAAEGCGEGGDAGLRPWPPARPAPAAGRPAQAAASLPTACSGLHCSGLGAVPARGVMHMYERRGGSIVLSERAAARWRGRRRPRGGGRRAGQVERMKRREPRAAAARGLAGSHGGERADRQVGAGRRCARGRCGARAWRCSASGRKADRPAAHLPHQPRATWSRAHVLYAPRPSPGPLLCCPEAGRAPRAVRKAGGGPGLLRSVPPLS